MVNLDEINIHPLQSNAWATFRREWGNEVLETKYGIITLHRIPLTHYKIGVFEKGPAPTKEMVNDLIKIGQQNNLIFIKLEPNIEKSNVSKSIIQLINKYCVPGKRLFTPTTFVINLTPSEENLLASFTSKTRYNIRLAERKGVKVHEDNSDKAFGSYLKLTKETSKRQGFYAHTEKYHRLMWKHLHQKLIANGQQPLAHLFTATYKNKIITTWILFIWKDTLYYPYGASSEEYKNVMANNLMMWKVIKFGKSLGLKRFDLWGREEGRGFTKFKEGYNPKVVEFLGTWDLVINKPLYNLYMLADRIRWFILHLKAKFLFFNS